MDAEDWAKAGFMLAFVALVIAAVIGWVLNLIILFGSSGQEIGAEFVLRCVGIVIPFVGAVMGYL